MSEQFKGFDIPRENYSKLPHALIEELPRFDGQAELAVVLYILRHTWGYQEFESPKRITLDEFQNGRKRKDGSRMDGGVGMGRAAIIRGLERAEKHGFIEVEIDDRDKARIRKEYKVRMQGFDNRTSEVLESYSGGAEIELRTEKDTTDTNLGKNNGADAPTPSQLRGVALEKLREKGANKVGILVDFKRGLFGREETDDGPRAAGLLRQCGEARGAVDALWEAYHQNKAPVHVWNYVTKFAPEKQPEFERVKANG